MPQATSSVSSSSLSYPAYGDAVNFGYSLFWAPLIKLHARIKNSTSHDIFVFFITCKSFYCNYPKCFHIRARKRFGMSVLFLLITTINPKLFNWKS
jgi:hypothetical protein